VKIEAYAERRLDPEKVFKILSQTEELIRFAEPEHRREIVRLLCRKITVRVDGKVEILATLPAERALRSISVALGSTPGAEVYQLGLQQDTVADLIDNPIFLRVVAQIPTSTRP
jgi:hypothetical protein